jgi:nicotinamide-nucleotide amidase
MIARILAIGDELTLGRTVDTNSSHISRFLTDRGLHVERIQVVGDGQEGIEQALASAAEGADLVVVSGGLGPTDDDRTRYALSAVAGAALGLRPRAWQQVRRWFTRLRPGFEIPESNRRQALLPRGSHILDNDRGTAPGILMRIAGCPVACLPGVPHEMVAMLERLGARLPRLVPGLRPPTIAELWFAGIGESTAQELIGDLLTEHRPQVGITVSDLGHITLRIVGTATEVAARRTALRRCIAPYLLPKPGIATSLVDRLARRGWSISAAESCTCGQVAAQLGAVPGASRVLRQSLVAYHPEAKRRLLGVSAALVRRHGIVSEAVARQMAIGARRWSSADVAVATTGVAGPGGSTPGRPVGTVCLAVAVRHGVVTRTIQVSGSRERIQRRAAGYALLMAWEVASGRLAPGRA